jgi:hypothetical protein
MFRRHAAAAAAVLALTLLTACDDKKDAPVAPTAPAPAAAAMNSAPSTNVAAAIGNQAASICRGYKKKQAGLQTAISKSPANAPGLAALKAKDQALTAIIKDACQ